MFVTIYDKMVDQLINDFYYIVSKKNKEDMKQAINSFIKDKVTSYLNEITDTKQGINIAMDIIKIYLTHYLYLYHFFTSNIKEDVAKDYLLKNSKELTPENIQSILQLLNILYSLANVKDKIDITSETKDIYDRLSENDKELFLDKDNKMYEHNIIKLVILNLLHTKNNRLTIFNSLKTTSDKKKKIDVVISTKDYIDQMTIESFMQNLVYDDEDQILHINEIYDFITKSVSIEYDFTNSEKVKQIIESGIFIPITNDFLRYHQDNYMFASGLSHQKTRKLGIMVELTSFVKQLYNNSLTDDDRHKINTLIKRHDRGIIYTNYIEEIRILTRLKNDFMGKDVIDDEQYYEFMLYFDDYYQDFNNFEKGIGTYITFDKTIQTIRYPTVQLILKTSSSGHFDNILETRTIAREDINPFLKKNKEYGIIGLAIKDNKYKNYYNILISNVEHKSEDLNGIKDKLYSFFKKKHKFSLSSSNPDKNTKVHYWIFHENQEDLRDEPYDIIQKDVNGRIAELYDIILENIYINIRNEIKEKKSEYLYDFYDIVRQYDNKKYTLPLNIYSDRHIALEKDITDRIKSNIDIYDERSNKEIDLKKLIKLDIIGKEVEETIYKNSVCQHYVSWQKIKSMNRKENKNYNRVIFEFIKKFAVSMYSGENLTHYVCGSCQDILNIFNFVNESAFDDFGNVVTFYSVLYVSILDIPRYQEIADVVDFIDRKIEKISDVLGITFYSGYGKKRDRENKTKEIIDIIQYLNNKIKYNHHLYKQDYKIITEKYEEDISNKGESNKLLIRKEYEIQKQNLKEKYIYDMKRQYNAKQSVFDIVDFTKMDDNDVLNKIIAYIMASMILDMSYNEIIILAQTKEFNILTYNKYKSQLFNKLEIRKNSNIDETILLDSIEILSFLIYMFSVSSLKHKVWLQEHKYEGKYGRVGLSTQKIVIDTIVDILNNIIENNPDRIKDFYKHVNETSEHVLSVQQLFEVINIKYFSKVKSVYNDKILKKSLIKHAKQFYDIKDKKEIYDEVEIFPIDSKIFRIYRWVVNYLNNVPIQWATRVHKFDYVDLQYKINNKLTNESIELIIKRYNDEYSKKLENNKKSLDIIHEHNINRNIKFLKSIEKKKLVRANSLEKNMKIVKSIKNSYDKRHHFMGKFLKTLDIHLNKEGNLNINIYENKYKMSHHYQGFKREIPLYMKESQLEIGSVDDVNYYKMDVIFFRSKDIEYFFQQKSLRYLGYKKINKYYISDETLRMPIYLEVIYSLKILLQYIGLPFENIRDNFFSKDDVTDWWSNNGYIRNTAIKKSIRDMQTYINRLKYGLTEISTETLENIDPLIKMFKFELIDINLDISGSSGNDIDNGKKRYVFKYWDILHNNIFFNKSTMTKTLDKLDIKNSNPYKFVKYDIENDMLLYYLTSEFSNLLKANERKETLLCSFFYEYLKQQYKATNHYDEFDYIDKMIVKIYDETFYDDAYTYIQETLGIEKFDQDVDRDIKNVTFAREEEKAEEDKPEITEGDKDILENSYDLHGDNDPDDYDFE